MLSLRKKLHSVVDLGCNVAANTTAGVKTHAKKLLTKEGRSAVAKKVKQFTQEPRK